MGNTKLAPNAQVKGMNEFRWSLAYISDNYGELVILESNGLNLNQMKRQHSHQTHQIDSDPYSTAILEELLDAAPEWRSVDDILKLTFRALTDLIAVHSHSIKDIKAVLTTRASKQEMMTGFSLKANISDVSQSLQTLSAAITSKPSATDLATALREYATREQVNSILQQQRDSRDAGDVAILKARMDQFQRQISKKVSGCCSLNQFRQLLSIVEGKANINEMNQALQTKISKQFLASALQKKISKTDVDLLLAGKADTSDLQYIVQSLESKVTLTTLQKLTQVIENKADKSEIAFLAQERQHSVKAHNRQIEQDYHQKIEQFKVLMAQESREHRRQTDQIIRKCDEDIESLKKEINGQIKKGDNLIDIQLSQTVSRLRFQLTDELNGVKNVLKNLQDQLQFRMSHDGLTLELTKEASIRKRSEQQIYEEIDDVRKRVEEIASATLERKDFIDFKSELFEALDAKVQAEDVQLALNRFETQINAKHAHQSEKVLSLHHSVNEALAIQTADFMEIKKSLGRKVEKTEFTIVQEMSRKTRKEVEECRKTVDTVYTQIHNKLSIKEYEVDLLQMRRKFDGISKEMILKANIKDVCVLADSKPNIDDVNNALKELNTALDMRMLSSELNQILKEQATINETLCSQAIIGRWLWQSGELKAGGLIPWENQCANTVPDHFFWEKDKTSILILAAGIYQITACVFASNCMVSLLANGEVLGVAGGKNEQNVGVNVKKAKKRKEKEICGTFAVEFAMLPARSRISVSSSESAEGFLNLRRL